MPLRATAIYKFKQPVRNAVAVVVPWLIFFLSGTWTLVVCVLQVIRTGQQVWAIPFILFFWLLITSFIFWVFKNNPVIRIYAGGIGASFFVFDNMFVAWTDIDRIEDFVRPNNLKYGRTHTVRIYAKDGRIMQFSEYYENRPLLVSLLNEKAAQYHYTILRRDFRRGAATAADLHDMHKWRKEGVMTKLSRLEIKDGD